MANIKKVIKGLECIIWEVDHNSMWLPGDDAIRDAIALLKEQEESIPVSWLTEKLEGHPELPYAVTDGINWVLDLWEGR